MHTHGATQAASPTGAGCRHPGAGWRCLCCWWKASGGPSPGAALAGASLGEGEFLLHAAQRLCHAALAE